MADYSDLGFQPASDHSDLGFVPAAPPSHGTDTKPGWDTFKSNMGQVGTVGEYLHAARAALGLPSLDDLLHAPASLLGWARHGNQPSGGFLSENPVADAATTATAAIAPPDLASIRDAPGIAKDVAGAVAGDVAAGAKSAGTTAKAAAAKLKGSVSAAAPDVGAGAMKAASGVGLSAAAHAIGVPYAGDVLLGAQPVSAGVRQIARGVKKGFQAATAAPAPEPIPVSKPSGVLNPGGVNSPVRPPLRAPEIPDTSPPDTSTWEGEGGSQPQGVQPPPELLRQLNATPEEPQVATPPAVPPTWADTGAVTPPPEAQAALNGGASNGRTNGRMSRAAAAANDAYTLQRRTKSAEEMAQFIARDPKQAQGILDLLQKPDELPDNPSQADLDRFHALGDTVWTELKRQMKQDQLSRIEQAGGKIGQSEVMNLKNVSAPDPATRRMAIQRAQEILQQNAAKSPKPAPVPTQVRTGMGAMKRFRTDYNPAALTDAQINALNQ